MEDSKVSDLHTAQPKRASFIPKFFSSKAFPEAHFNQLASGNPVRPAGVSAIANTAPPRAARRGRAP